MLNFHSIASLFYSQSKVLLIAGLVKGIFRGKWHSVSVRPVTHGHFKNLS